MKRHPFHIKRARLNRLVLRFVRRWFWIRGPRRPQQARPASAVMTKRMTEPLVVLWQFAWACMVLIVGSRYLWLLGIAGAGR